jgi:hypothetical protein
MFIPAQTNLTIECPRTKPFFPVHLFSNVSKALPVLDATATLSFIGCDVNLLPSRMAAANDPPAPLYAANYFGGSLGSVVLTNSRFLISSEVGSSL